MKAKILGLLAVGLLVGQIQLASAYTIQTGVTLEFNFDWTPSPAMTVVTFIVSFPNGLGENELLAANLYGELDGVDQLPGGFVIDDASPGTTYVLGYDYAGLLDGVFSIRLKADDGPFDFDLCARAGESGDCLRGTPFGSVPEPGTLALLGLGLAGLGLSRRRKA